MLNPEWYEDDDYWKCIEGFLFAHFRNPEITVEEAGQIAELLGAQPPATILDLCCGTGRHSLEWTRRGFRVTGLDRTQLYLEKARLAARKEGLDIEFIQQDMRHFCRPKAFSYALNLFSSFGYFSEPGEDVTVLKNVCQSLEPRGKILMEMMGKEVLSRDFEARNWDAHPNGREFLLQEATVADGWDRIDNHWIWIREGQRKRVFKFGLRIYSGGELTQALHQAGFSQVRLYGSLEGIPYDNEAQRLVAVARK